MFSASEAGSSFECLLDTAAYAACASPQGYAGLVQGPHTFSVRAIDGSGNVDATPSSIVWVVDTLAPDTTIATKPQALSNSAAASFTFSSDETGTTFECKLDVGDFDSCGASQTYTNLADGQHVLTVHARDTAGNVDASPASHTWTVDTVAPETTIASAPPDPSGSGLAVFTFSSSEPGSSFECMVDTSPFTACTSPSSHSLADGTHTFQVPGARRRQQRRPRAGSSSRGGSTPSRGTPSITAKPRDPINSSDAVFAFSSSYAGMGFECSLERRAVRDLFLAQVYTGPGRRPGAPSAWSRLAMASATST